MTTRKSFGYFQAVLIGVLLCATSGVFSSIGYAAQFTTNITSDNTLGSTVAQAGNVYNINGGTTKGTNQFHSFGQFSVGTGDIASFNGPAGIQNILSRVTGGTRSDIDGTLRSTISGANLFLMNPSGILFGPNAQLDVSGSFHATTANYIGLTDGTRFNAIASADGALLTAAPPAAFGFLTSNPAPIDVLAGTVDETTAPPVTITSLLKVPEGKALSLVGGTVNVGGQVDLNNDGTPDVSGPGYILAPGGHVNLVSVASSGEATFDSTNINGSIAGPVAGNPSTRDINVSGFGQLGNISITQGSIVDAKEVSITGGKLVIDTAAVYPGAFWLYSNLPSPSDPNVPVLTVSGLSDPLPAPDGGLVNVNITGDVSIRGNALVPVINDLSGILTFAGFLFAEVPGDVPNIHLNAHSLTLSGETADIQTARFGPGKAADVSITADSVRIENGASIDSLNFFQGPGGSITVNAGDLVIDGSDFSGFTGLAAQGLFHPGYLVFSIDPIVYTADAGTITVNASNNVTLRNSAFISASSFAFGAGGGVTVNTKNLSLDNGASIIAEGTLGGPAGNVEINASGQVNLTNFSQISSTTTGSGSGGNVVVTAGQPITVSSSAIFASTVPPNQALLDLFASHFAALFAALGIPTESELGIPNYAELQSFITLISGIPNPSIFEVLGVLRDPAILGFALLDIPDSALIPGNGGAISITTPLLTVNNGAAVSSSTGWDGNAGAVTGNVGSLFVESGGEIRSRAGLLENTGQGFAVGDAGSLRLNATDTIRVSGGSISTTTIGDGTAGNISLSANQVSIQNGGSVTSSSGQTANGQLFVGAGNAGQITVVTPTLTMGDSAVISVATTGTGNAGNIALNVNNFTQTGGARVDSSTSGSGSGGDVTVMAANLASLSGTGTGLFSTASSSGAGGDINVQAPQVEILDGATMSADSTGTATATAGNVNIVTADLNMQNSSITTGATLADGGNISITTTGSMVHLTNSQITTSVQSGVGGGGNILIDSDLVVLDDSRVLANAFGGPGGNIDIIAKVFLVNSGGQLPTSLAGIVDASSALSTPGTINIEAAFTDVSGEVAQLPEAPLQATELLRASCAARFAGGKASSLVLGGRDGVPIQPGGLLPSPLYLATDGANPAKGVKTSAYDPPTRFSLLGSADSKNRLLNQYSLLPNFKCAL